MLFINKRKKSVTWGLGQSSCLFPETKAAINYISVCFYQCISSLSWITPKQTLKFISYSSSTLSIHDPVVCSQASVFHFQSWPNFLTLWAKQCTVMQIFFLFFFYWLFCNILVLVLASHTVVQKFGIASSFQKTDRGSRAPITVSVFLQNENIFYWNNEIMLKNVHSIEGSVPEVIFQKNLNTHIFHDRIQSMFCNFNEENLQDLWTSCASYW